MSESKTTMSVDDLNRAVQETWDRKAAFWDEQVGDGNLFQRVLTGPAVERLLDVQPGEVILEIACGNGVVSRRLASLGAHVVATDFSAAFLARARARPSEHPERIEYALVDATDERQLLALGEGQFDAAVCNMGLMDMARIDPPVARPPRASQAAGALRLLRVAPGLQHRRRHHAGLRDRGS